MLLANTIVKLKPGMYILRHPKGGLPPLSLSRAAVDAEPGGRIEALYSPRTHGAVLRDGADCVVMQVLDAPVSILVTAYLPHAGAAVPALRVDEIALDAGAGAIAPAKAEEPKPKGIALAGHIERRGDVVAQAGELLGEPGSDLRLEGFQVMWPDKPAGLDLRYSARSEGTGALPAVTSGHFAGTRNEARRVVEVTFSLTGAKATQYELKGKAHFSGGFQMDIAPDMPLSGPSGMEHLTGLKLQVVPAQPKQVTKNPWDASPRTRVLKAVAAEAKPKSAKKSS